MSTRRRGTGPGPGDTRKKRQRRYKLSNCAAISIVTGIVALFVVVVVLAHRQWRQAALCFHLDILRHRSPRPLGKLRVPRANEPIGNGPLCVHADQNALRWRIDETFTYAYDGDIVDFTLHGPLPDTADTAAAAAATPAAAAVAPAVAELGVHRATRTSALRGTKFIDADLVRAIAAHPQRYYVAFHALDEDGRGVSEVARDYLDKPEQK
jgi:hypothetical protein